VPRLRRADCATEGITRRRRGKGFEYRDSDGKAVRDPDVRARIDALAIPPAWEDVWICPFPNGHIQATGTDVAGRKQYRYHDDWRVRRDAAKFDSMLEFAAALPRLRRRVTKDLKLPGAERARVLACAARLLDRGSFRIGSEGYAAENESYGLATIRLDHVSLPNGAIRFDYSAKGGAQRVQSIVDDEAREVVALLKRRRGGGDELLAYKEGHRWRDVKSEEINDYLRAGTGGEHTAKDFRTWNATVFAAIALAAAGQAPRSTAARSRAKRHAIEEVAHKLGNTPAVCKASYIDPRIFDRYDGGLTIGGVFPQLATRGEWPAIHRSVEEATLDLLAGDAGAPGVERIKRPRQKRSARRRRAR
jgi:DNA topoisomerase-1